jgi:Domain of unknown function (DUF4410)
MMRMRKISNILLSAFAIVMVTGCASTKVYDQQRVTTGPLPRPNQIWVFDFVGTPADVPSDSNLAKTYTIVTSPQTAEQIQLGRELGGKIADKLVEEIRGMGMPVSRAFTSRTTSTLPNDIVIRGYLASIEEGSAAGRMAIGFGAGGSELRTVVEGLQVTPEGLRMIGSATVEAKGSKGPGAGVGAASWAITGNPAGFIVSSGMKIYGEASGSATVEGRAKSTAKEIADRLKERFKEYGWIN